MTSIATLKATNCSRLLYVTEQTVAACGTKTAYVFQYTGQQVKEASCTAPREADVFVPWLPPGAPLNAVRAVYSTPKAGGSAVLVQPAKGPSSASAPLEVVELVADKVVEMRIFYQSVLALQTDREVRFYFLDPSTAAATLMGVCALPSWADSRDVRVDVTSSECWAGAAEKTVCVMCLSPERVFAAVVVCASSTSAVVVRQTIEAGVALPTTVPSPVKVLGWTVRWARQELLLLLSGAEGDAGKTSAVLLAALSLQEVAVGGALARLEKWASPAALAASLSGASDDVLRSATDVCSDGDGTHVWLCDTVTGPSVVLREVANAGTAESAEVVLTGTNASARVTVARGMPGMFVLAGRGLYVVRGTGGSRSAGAELEKAGAAAAVAAVDDGPAEATMSAWLQKRAEANKEGAAVAPPQEERETEEEQKTNEEEASAATRAASSPSEMRSKVAHPKPSMKAFTANAGGIKEKVLQYVLGTAASVPFVVRDTVYVREAAATGAAPHHEILSAIAEKFGGSPAHAEERGVALLRYAGVAQSLHPYTVLALLNLRSGQAAAASDGLMLAIATLLAEKSTLQHGGLQRLPNFAATSAAFFATPGGAFPSTLAKKLYTADVCAAAMAALASGGLGATRLLFAVADRAVSMLYGGRAEASAETTSEADAAAERAGEVVIADAISLMRSFVDWSLTASSSLGVMTAHIGAPQTLTKEAALRDGRAHPIDTSRQVEIRPLKVVRMPKRTL